MNKHLFLFIILFSAIGYSQEESFPCAEGNEDLKKVFQGSILENLYVHSCSGPGLDVMSTSFLFPTGEAPKIIKDPTGNGPPEDSKYVSWTCQYSPGNIGDGSSASAWVEGAKGYGIGEGIVVPCLDLKKTVEIWIGYGKSDKLFKYNSRPSKIKLVVLKAELGDVTQYGEIYKNVQSIASDTVLLQDLNSYQTISIPSYTKETYFSEMMGKEKEYKYFLGIQILDIYKGDKWDDTCISEVRNKPTTTSPKTQ